jgi:threonyl-tRNA synthetase
MIDTFSQQAANLSVSRHSMAHLLAAAVQDMFPEAVFGVGPVIEQGSYYDFILPRTLIPEDLGILEGKMRTLLMRNIAFKSEKMEWEEALALFVAKNQPLKIELLEDLKKFGTTNLSAEVSEAMGTDPEITIWRLVDEDTGEVLFEDLCKGPHVSDAAVSLKKLGFSLDKFSAAYWRGDQSRNISMQRLYMLLFATQAEHDSFVTAREEAKQFDHRILGQQLDLFSFSELVGAGLPLFTPRGTTVRNAIKSLLFQISKRFGAKEVTIPHMAKIELYETSGHAKKFAGELFHVKSHYNVDFVLKPVNCPHHTQIYASQPRSYRDLPLRYIESTMQYRDEKPGQIGGLTRVRAITCDDGHTFCTPDQIHDEIFSLCQIIKEFYTSINMYEGHWVSISVRDYAHPENYTGTPEDWDKAEKMLKDINQELGLNGKICEGEAAIYGPKLDFMYKDLQGNDRQLSTVQLDFATPQRFGLTYTDVDGSEKPPVMIHRAILGSYERFLAILLERTKGHFPLWMAPEQVRILTVNNDPAVLDYVAKIEAILSEIVLNIPLKYNELRYEKDIRNEGLGKKLKEALVMKIPVILIVGPRDIEAGVVSVRTQKGEEKVELNKLKAIFITQ